MCHSECYQTANINKSHTAGFLDNTSVVFFVVVFDVFMAHCVLQNYTTVSGVMSHEALMRTLYKVTVMMVYMLANT